LSPPRRYGTFPWWPREQPLRRGGLNMPMNEFLVPISWPTLTHTAGAAAARVALGAVPQRMRMNEVRARRTRSTRQVVLYAWCAACALLAHPIPCPPPHAHRLGLTDCGRLLLLRLNEKIARTRSPRARRRSPITQRAHRTRGSRWQCSTWTARQVRLGAPLAAAAGRRSRARARPATAATGRRGGAAAAAIRLGCGLAGAERRSRGGEVASSGCARDRTRPYVHREVPKYYVKCHVGVSV